MNRISLDAMKTMSLDQIIQLYNLGYRLEDIDLYKLKSLNNTSISFHITCSSASCKDVHIIINNVDRGITDSNGNLIIDGLAPGSKINFIATKLGFKDYNGEASTGESKEFNLEAAPPSDFSATLKFLVSEPGTTTQLPSYGSHIILDDQEFGVTNKFGILLVENLVVNTTIPFLVNKPGFPESFGIVKVETGTTEVTVNLQLFPTRALAIMRTALIGAIFLTSVGIIGNYLITHFLEKPSINYD